LDDFGEGNSFRTAITITYVVEHFNDPDKGYLNAVEPIIPGTGTGRFSNASGQFTTHGSICGVSPAS